jgi:hypothetical protein
VLAVSENNPQTFLRVNKYRKNKKLQTRNTIFMVLAKGGIPSGHTCPNKTIAFSIRRIIKIVFFILSFIRDSR